MTVIGYTAGVFELFHIGHLTLLEEASRHCDKLVVGVTTDDLSLSYKVKTPVICILSGRRLLVPFVSSTK